MPINSNIKVINAGLQNSYNTYLNPLAELNQCVFNPAYGLVVNVIDVLQCNHRTDFTHYSGKKTACFFYIYVTFSYNILLAI